MTRSVRRFAAPRTANGRTRSNDAGGPAVQRARQLTATPTRVLVGEEGREMRGMIASALRQAGHEVLVAKDACALLDLLDAAQSEDGDLAPFDGVIVDVTLPGQSRHGLVLQIRRIDPELPVIVMAPAQAVSNGDAFSDGADAVLSKPLDIEALRTVLRILLTPIPS